MSSWNTHNKKKRRGREYSGSVVIQRALDSGLGLRDACVGRSVIEEIRWREWRMHRGVGDLDALMRECKMLERYL